jgi:hypothetical protein
MDNVKIPILVEKNGFKMKITYSNEGYFESVVNIVSDEFMKIELRMDGAGYKIKNENFITIRDSSVCDARYIKVIDANIFVPRMLFIENNYKS